MGGLVFFYRLSSFRTINGISPEKNRSPKRVQRFVISTKPMKGKTIARWGKRRWQIEGFLKTAKYQFSLHRFGQKTLLGVYRWLILSFVSYLLAYWVYLHLGNFDNLACIIHERIKKKLESLMQ